MKYASENGEGDVQYVFLATVPGNHRFLLHHAKKRMLGYSYHLANISP